jgi:hypothetical protein
VSVETPGRCYLYGFVADAHSAETASRGLAGLEGEDVHLVQGRAVSALASRFTAERARGTRQALRAHEAVVAAVAGATTVVPLRFGVVMPDRSAVDRLLGFNESVIGAELQHLRGRRQYRVKATYVGDAALRDVVAASPAVRRLSSAAGGGRRPLGYGDRIRLGEMVVEGLARLRSSDADTVVDRLAGVAAATSVLPVRGEGAALDIAVLVADRDAPALEEAVESLAAASTGRLAFQLVGPTAAWDFTRTDPISAVAVAGTGR